MPPVRDRAFECTTTKQVRFTDGTSMTHTVAEAPSYDGFDSWCAVRDKRLDSSLSARYVAEGTVGYEDLDDNGVWTEEPPYGHVWIPPTWRPAGHLTRTDTGFGWRLGAGRGSMTPLGVMRRFTMAAGSTQVAIGVGRRDLFMRGRIMLQRWSHGLVDRVGA